ncbi:MAG: DUF6588 family protein [Algibacter sp.]
MKKLTLMMLLFFVTQFSKAQELESILLAADDASKLTENYIRPVMNGLMYSMNGGWATTAKTHKKFGFDLTISVNASMVPTADEVFQFIPSDYQFASLPNGETSVPTVMGSDDSETTVDIRVPYQGNSYKVTSFQMPGGITEDLPINAVPAPMVQIGFGLPSKTDIKVRYVPTLNFDDSVEASLIGLGLQHDLMQYFGPLDKLPLSVSVLAAFTKMDVTYAIEDEDSSDDIAITDGAAEFKMNTWTVQALGSLDFKIVTLYASLGYNNGSSSIKMKGDYELTYEVEDNNGTPVGTVDESISDPINLDFDANGMRSTIGARLNLGPFKIFGDYTLQEYNTVSAGIALSFR